MNGSVQLHDYPGEILRCRARNADAPVLTLAFPASNLVLGEDQGITAGGENDMKVSWHGLHI
jgi:hypothetical protein